MGVSGTEWVTFWNANGSIVKLMDSILDGVCLWYRPCYKNVLNCGNGKKYWKLTTM